MNAYQHRVFDALGDPTRRAIFERLERGPCSVGDLAAKLPVSRPAVSQHLKVLADAGLVEARADGTRRLYEVRAAGLEVLKAYLDRFWDDSLDQFKQAAERAAKERKR